MAARRPVAELGLEKRSPLSAQRSKTLLGAFFAKRSEITVRNYRIDLVHFGRWLRGGGPETLGRSKRKLNLDAVDPGKTPEQHDAFVADALREFFELPQLEALATVLGFQADLQSGVLGRKFASQTINHRISAIRAVSDLARILGFCAFNLDEVKTLPRARVRSTEGCGEDGYARCLEEVELQIERAKTPIARFRATRNAVLVRFMFDAALRRFEGPQIRYPEGINLDTGSIFFRGKKQTEPAWFEVLTEDTVDAIRLYLKDRGEQPGFLLYGSRIDRPIALRSINKIVTKISKDTGVQITPHGMRHTTATIALDESNGNVRAVAALLRHKGLGTVQEYDDARKKLPKQMSNLLRKTREKKGST